MDKAPIIISLKTIVQAKLERCKIRYQIYYTGHLQSTDIIKFSTLQQLQQALPTSSDFISKPLKTQSGLYIKFSMQAQFFLLHFTPSSSSGYEARCLATTTQQPGNFQLAVPKFVDVLEQFQRVCGLKNLQVRRESCKIRQINVQLSFKSGSYKRNIELIRSPNDFYGGIVKLSKGAEAIHIAGNGKVLDEGKTCVVWYVQIIRVDFDNMIQSVGECLDAVFDSWGE
ncbi:hypothetical protein SS50377_22711 [Spironucleus salmonicida]|uniref:Uncharacterized protein n=1 Tax=Spironucleus salmonicida TaxID=348837 RepID=V6LIP8_9EUKA|nr:hypothetical protein SS50377_22711 [Spironucleus salmonicida]|eukprot:EST44188.1 Hypothetical protein SS50377_15994 [Spironucleus salmonicida]